MTALIRPILDRYDSWAECVRDYGDEFVHGSGFWAVTDGRLDPTPDNLARTVAIAERESDLAQPPPEGRVHCDQFWITDGEPGATADPSAQVIGFLSLRHDLATEFLRTEGGHVGYSIRPARRREGHASRALGLALRRCRELGLDRVLVTCEESNLASARTIESQGGVFESVWGDKRRYWIAT